MLNILKVYIALLKDTYTNGLYNDYKDVLPTLRARPQPPPLRRADVTGAERAPPMYIYIYIYI